MRLLRTLAVLIAIPVTSLAGSITTVSPGPGTPLQDAINAAAPNSTLVLEPTPTDAIFTEAVVINKPLTLRATARQGDRGVGIDASSTNAAFAVDITADNVTLRGSSPEFDLQVYGGTTASIHIAARTRIRFIDVGAGVDFGQQPTALLLDGTTGISIKRGEFISNGSPAVRMVNIPTGAKININGGDMKFFGGDFRGNPALLIQDSGVGTTVLGKGGIRLQKQFAIGGGVVIANSSGILVRGPRVRFLPPPAIGCSDSDCTALTLGGSSTLNHFVNVAIQASGNGSVAVSDAGTGNCGDNLTYIGTGTLAPCH
jgi:hypothetical protein